MKIKSISTSKSRLAITLGDPAGIGLEVILKALAEPSIRQDCQITIIGSISLLEQAYQQLRSLRHLSKDELVCPDDLSIVDIELEPSVEEKINIGMGNAASGKASFSYLQEALKRTLDGEFDAIVTAPIAKSCWQMAGHKYPGQTEVLAQAAGVDKFGMLFVAKSPYTGVTLRTLLATTHIPLKEVSQFLTPELMTQKLELLIECLKSNFRIDQPEIVIAGLNPHSGEKGQLGTEEQDWLIPWLEEEQKKRPDINLVGLIPPDTMWVTPAQAWYGNAPQSENSLAKNIADGYLALYHDQGLIPVKLMAFDRAVNTTIGLPFVRTSPDHGTAFDIAGKGIARAQSMKEAIILAAELASASIQ